eukprot:COSAG01_NODE_1835_length_9084_cov_87.179481_7_plen_173_part_00
MTAHSTARRRQRPHGCAECTAVCLGRPLLLITLPDGPALESSRTPARCSSPHINIILISRGLAEGRIASQRPRRTGDGVEPCPAFAAAAFALRRRPQPHARGLRRVQHRRQRQQRAAAAAAVAHRRAVEGQQRQAVLPRRDQLRSERPLIESRWGSKPLAFAGKMRPRRLNN